MANRRKKAANGDVVEKKSISIYAPLTLIQRFDEYMKRHGLKVRADALDDLLRRVETDSPGSSGAVERQPAKKRAVASRAQDPWLSDDVDKLRRALDACKPSTDEQWQTVANSVGGSHTWEQCKKYAVSKLRYRVKRSPAVALPKRTLRGRQERHKVLRELVRDEADGSNDIFKDEPQMMLHRVPALIDAVDISCLTTPASAISYTSRFELDSSSACLTPSASFTELKKEVGSEARKRANRCMNKLQPLLCRAVNMKAGSNQCTPKATPKRTSKRPRPSNGMAWGKLGSRTADVDGETDEDTYFSEN